MNIYESSPDLCSTGQKPLAEAGTEDTLSCQENEIYLAQIPHQATEIFWYLHTAGGGLNRTPGWVHPCGTPAGEAQTPGSPGDSVCFLAVKDKGTLGIGSAINSSNYYIIESHSL